MVQEEDEVMAMEEEKKQGSELELDALASVELGLDADTADHENEVVEEQDLEELSPEDAVDKDEELDVHTLLLLLRHVKVKLVSTMTMDRLIHADS